MNDDEFPCFHRDNLKTADLVEFCRRLQLNEPLEPLLRDWKTKERCEKCKSFTKKAKSGEYNEYYLVFKQHTGPDQQPVTLSDP